jgi:hypothetical protein
MLLWANNACCCDFTPQHLNQLLLNGRHLFLSRTDLFECDSFRFQILSTMLWNIAFSIKTKILVSLALYNARPCFPYCTSLPFEGEAKCYYWLSTFFLRRIIFNAAFLATTPVHSHYGVLYLVFWPVTLTPALLREVEVEGWEHCNFEPKNENRRSFEILPFSIHFS